MNYTVVINSEKQYALWPAKLGPPFGWQEVGPSGSKEECLAAIEESWLDMRPLSMQKRMEVVGEI